MGETRPLDYESSAAPVEPPRGALGVIFLIVLIDLLGFGIIIPLLPFYVPGFKENALKVTLTFSIYSIFQFIGAPILGMFSDRFGRRPVLVISQFGSAAGYLLLAIATRWHDSNPSLMLTLVYISRTIDGFTGGNLSTAQAYVSDVTTPANRARGMGVLGAAFGLGFCVGPFLGGTLGHYHPAWPAYAAAALSLSAGVLSYLRLKEPARHATTEVGATHASAWLHPSRFAPILRRPVLVQLLAISFFTMAAFVMMESVIALYLNKMFAFEERHVGYFFGFLGVVIIVVQGGLIGRLTKIFGEWTLAVAGTLMVAIGMCGFIYTAWMPVLGLLLVAGTFNSAGRSFQQPTVSSLLSKFSDPREQGIIFGLYHGLLSLARVAGPVVAGLVYTLWRNTGAFATAATIALLMALWTLALRQPAPKADTRTGVAEAAVEVA